MDYFNDEIMQNIQPLQSLSIGRQVKQEIDRHIEKIERARNDLQESETRLWMDYAGIYNVFDNERVTHISHKPHTAWNSVKTFTDSIALDDIVQFTIFEVWHESKVVFSVDRTYLNIKEQ